jgi:hypothetical protein
MNQLTTPTPHSTLGLFGRLGRWSARRRRAVFLGWALLIIGPSALSRRASSTLCPAAAGRPTARSQLRHAL